MRATTILISVAAVLAASVSSPAVSADKKTPTLSIVDMARRAPLIKEECFLANDIKTGVEYCSFVAKVPRIGRVFTRCPTVNPFDPTKCQSARLPDDFQMMSLNN